MRPIALPALLGLFLLAAAPAARADRASELMEQQDWTSTPPRATPPLSTWIDWTRTKQGGEYERDGGQPFAAPVPPQLYADIEEILIVTDGGQYTTSSGGVDCTVVWSSEFASILFDDGSRFVWMKESSFKTCDDGSTESWDEVIATAGVEDPVTGAWSGRVRSYKRDAFSSLRRASFRASAGGTLDLASQAGKLADLGYDAVDLTVGPGGVLDLRGNPAAAGPLFDTTGPVTLRCDTVLLDPGVVLADLFQPPPIVLPASIVNELALVGPTQAYFEAGLGGPADVVLRALNLGNASEVATLSWSDTGAWSSPPPPPFALDPLGVPVDVPVPLTVPPGAQPGDTSDLAAQLSSPAAPPAQRDALLAVVPPAPTGTAYCVAKPNSLGCTPQIGWTGAATASGYDDLMVLGSNVRNGLNGLLFHGFAPAALPFLGGTLCVQPPLQRTAIQNAGGSVGPPDCSGVYALHLTQAYLAAAGAVPGTTLHCQYWSRDPAAPFATGLTNAAALPIGP